MDPLRHALVAQPPPEDPSKQAFDWFFSTLWLGCGRVDRKCRINIPDTVLFAGGEPRKWITSASGTHGGVVSRLNFSKPSKNFMWLSRHGANGTLLDA